MRVHIDKCDKYLISKEREREREGIGEQPLNPWTAFTPDLYVVFALTSKHVNCSGLFPKQSRD